MSAGARLPGVVLLLAAVILLALVSFNVPLLKNFYFLEGRFSSGQYKGSIRLGTLGFCVDGDQDFCVGPQIGYSFDLNTILNIPKNLISIPTSISKYLTYALVLHIIGLGFAAIGLIMALLDMIPGFNMLCFPTCMASIASSATLIAFIFDLAIFFISKAAITKSGASADIGAAVWMTLAAWVCCSVSICASGMANCCCGGCGGGKRDRGESRRERKRSKNKKDRDDDSFDDDYRRDHDMRLHAMRDEERRKYQQDLPSFQPYEREPLNPGPPEDKYMYDDAPPLTQGGTGVNGVGMGYGRRNGAPNPYAQAGGVPGNGGYGQTLNVQRQPSTGSSMMTAGNAGVGAGGEGVDHPRNQYGHADQEQMHDNNNYDPYAQAGPSYEYAQAGAGNPAYPPVAHAAMTSPQRQRGQNDYFSGGPGSSDSHLYQDPGPRVDPAEPYPTYDDGLGAIGRAATSPTGERQYTGAQGYGSAGYGAMPAPLSIPPTPAPMQIPTPQRLVNPLQQNILQSPDSEYSRQGPYSYHQETEAPGPPSYGQATHNTAAPAAGSFPQEKR